MVQHQKSNFCKNFLLTESCIDDISLLKNLTPKRLEQLLLNAMDEEAKPVQCVKYKEMEPKINDEIITTLHQQPV